MVSSGDRTTTAFQERSCASVVKLLRKYGRQGDLEKVSGQKEDYYRIRVLDESRRLEVFVYEDEAGYFTGTVWRNFETQGYDSQEALLRAFLDALENELEMRGSGAS